MDITPRFVGIMRIKNESRWIQEVIASQLSLCERIFILDDHSTDNTVELCRKFKEVAVDESPFSGLDETRDKNYLFQKLRDYIPWPCWNINNPFWALCLDGDEILDCRAPEILQHAARTDSFCFSLRVAYLWNDRHHVRTDGVYGHFHRPSLFRLINPDFTYQSTPWGGNFHCSNIPQEYLGHAKKTDALIWHLGYIDREDRLRKYEWYNRIDPGNQAEDCYRHMVQGDIPEVPPHWTRGRGLNHLLHAGPLQLESI